MQFRSAILLASFLLVNTVHGASSPTERSRDVLIGTWSTSNYFGHLVNPATGAVVQSLHSGRWFTFNANGTYQYMRIASGRLISGVVVAQGTYELIGNRLNLHRKTESWYPSRGDLSGRPMYKDRRNPESSIVYVEFRGPAEMVLREEDDTVSTFRRDPNSK
jgi:hypothetical protein